jgi:hypothetical protein
MTNRILITLCAIVLAGCEVTVEDNTEVEWLQAPGTEDRDRPFSAAVRVDNLLFLSGQIGYDSAAGALVEGGIQAETRKTLEGIAQTLDDFGSSMDRVVNVLSEQAGTECIRCERFGAECARGNRMYCGTGLVSSN